MITNNLSKILGEIISFIDILDSAYENAERRYNDLGYWLLRPGSKTNRFSPEIKPQGSFRIGTVKRPFSSGEGYDIDISCRFIVGLTKSQYTQHQLKDLLGIEVEAYRLARNIEKELEEKRRCWRLLYTDGQSFHIDIVPSIPEDDTIRTLLREAMINFGIERQLALSASEHNSAITDNTRKNYDAIDPDWNVSNPEGHALWFEARMKQASALLESHAFSAGVASIDKIKPYRWKSPLQRIVQILKWHRDVNFLHDPDMKPVSIILTTLAAMAYQGEDTIEVALDNVLSKMRGFIRDEAPRVPNPVNPQEDFADKWKKNRQLEDNFINWIVQTQRDFQFLKTSRDPKQIREHVSQRFGILIPEIKIHSILDFSAPAIVTPPKTYTLMGTPAKPWRR
jgi:hypothetical protein